MASSLACLLPIAPYSSSKSYTNSMLVAQRSNVYILPLQSTGRGVVPEGYIFNNTYSVAATSRGSVTLDQGNGIMALVEYSCTARLRADINGVQEYGAPSNPLVFIAKAPCKTLRVFCTLDRLSPLTTSPLHWKGGRIIDP